MTTLGIVTGLKAEAKAVRRAARNVPTSSIGIAAAGIGPDRAAANAQCLVDGGAQALLSFGIAGALDPVHGPGAVVVATRVGNQNGRWIDTDNEWRARLAKKLRPELGDLVEAPVIGSAHVISSVAAKAALHSQTGAEAVDMESYAVAEVARACGVPLAVIRVISDHAGREIPSCALKWDTPDGGIRPFPVIGCLIRHPWEIPAIVRLARDAGRGFAVLGRVAALAGPDFALR